MDESQNLRNLTTEAKKCEMHMDGSTYIRHQTGQRYLIVCEDRQVYNEIVKRKKNLGSRLTLKGREGAHNIIGDFTSKILLSLKEHMNDTCVVKQIGKDNVKINLKIRLHSTIP